MTGNEGGGLVALPDESRANQPFTLAAIRTYPKFLSRMIGRPMYARGSLIFNENFGKHTTPREAIDPTSEENTYFYLMQTHKYITVPLFLEKSPVAKPN